MLVGGVGVCTLGVLISVAVNVDISRGGSVSTCTVLWESSTVFWVCTSCVLGRYCDFGVYCTGFHTRGGVPPFPPNPH